MANKIEGGNLTRKGRGRPKGSVNKVTATAKEIISEASDRLGGVARLVAWAKEAPENERAYWAQIFPKLLPLQVAGDPNAPLTHKIVREFVGPSNPNG